MFKVLDGFESCGLLVGVIWNFSVFPLKWPIWILTLCLFLSVVLPVGILACTHLSREKGAKSLLYAVWSVWWPCRSLWCVLKHLTNYSCVKGILVVKSR